MDVREGFEAQQQRSASASAACGPIDVSLGTAPHPAVRAGVAGLSEAFQTPEAVAAAWAGAQAEAEAFAERLGDEGLLDTTSLHRYVRPSTRGCLCCGACFVLTHLNPPCARRLTFLLAYSTLWLWQAGAGLPVGGGLSSRNAGALSLFSHTAALCRSPVLCTQTSCPRS